MPTPLLARRRELAFKIEATVGTAEAAPTDGTHSKVIIYDAKFVTDFQIYQRNPQRSSFSRLKHLKVNEPCRITFKCEVRRTGPTATVDKWASLLTCCRMLQTINAGTSVVYTPTSVTSNFKSATMWLTIDGLRLSIKGAMGNVKFSGKIGEPMFAEFDMLGTFNGHANFALQTVTHETGAVEAFQGISLTYGGSSALVASEVMLDCGNNVVLRKDVNDPTGVLSAWITDGAPTLEIDPELQLTTGIDFYSDLENDTEVAVGFDSGVGGLIAFNCPKAIISSIDDSERDGIQVAAIKMDLDGDSAAGDDEFSITMT